MNKESTCCFTGPRPTHLPMNGNEFSEEIIALKVNLRKAVLEAYEEGFRFFMNGMAEGFDLFAAETVEELKPSCPGMALVAVLPYSGVEKRHSAAVTKRISNILANADMIFSLEEKYVKGCELRRNIYMVEHSCRIIAYYNGLSGGTAHCWNCAVQNGIERVNLYEE